MSKRLKEVLANRLHISFLETIENDPCDFSGTLRLVVKEQNEDGTPRQEAIVRHVKLCHSQEVCAQYDIPIDPKCGVGTLTIKNITAIQAALVLVDEDGFQMMNGDEMAITYRVDGEDSGMDYATLVFDETSDSEREVEIINRAIPVTTLRITKQIKDQEGCLVEIDPQLEFRIRIVDLRGCEECVTLCGDNDFQVEKQLPMGRYFIEELPQRGFGASYCFNGSANVDNTFDLKPGENTLQIINEQIDATALTIEKYVRSGSGELCRPGRHEEFMVRIIGWNLDRVIALHDQNDFCMTLYDLEPGYYDINEISDHHNDEVSYMVNGCKENSFAHVELNSCDEANVMIINTNPELVSCVHQESPLRICKYIRRCDGCITRPDERDSFKVMLQGCGRCDTFLLNANNNFCVDVADLCDGCYEIKECGCGDYTTTYCVDDGTQRTTACVTITSGSCHHVAIINEERNRGSVSICKYIRNANGDLVKPHKDECFHVTLSSYFCKRDIVLNEENDWCMCFHDLRFGGYEVRECDEDTYRTTYQVNGDKERPYARFVIDDCCDNEVRIINAQRSVHSGILKICKYEETDHGELVKPSQDEEFCIEVSGPCFKENYTLRAYNNWCILLEGLQPGEYQIRECDCDQYEVSYVVNKEPMEDAYIYLGSCNQEVLIINHRKHCGRLKLYTLIRECDGTTRLPNVKEAFDILVEGCDTCLHTTLKASNGWCVLLDDLKEGTYRIIQTDTCGYQISYCIDYKETSFAKVSLGLQDVAVGIINQITDCSGTLTVTKYHRGEDGSLVMPCLQEEYRFELKGRGFCNTYQLNARNDFCVFFDDLEEGRYQIKELQHDGDVCYRIDGEEAACADFTLGSADRNVDIINTTHQNGLVYIEKRLKIGDTLLMPDPDRCYTIVLKGKHVHEVYELHHDNDFCICLQDMENQHYEISELHQSCHLYDINGTLQDNGYFLYEGKELHITLINEESLGGCMELSKQIEDEDGILRRPQRWECFEVLIESEDYKQKVTLSHDNDFRMRLYDLPQGHYEVKERNSGCVSYIVNDLPCESAVVDLCEQDVCVSIINHEGKQGCIEFQGCVEEDASLMIPKPQERFHLIISNQEQRYTIDLNQANDFCDHLGSLPPGAYTVTESSSAPIRFEIEGQVFEDVVCIELNGEHVCVNVVKTMPKKPTITITKRMQDRDGKQILPQCKDSFQITLLHNGRKQMFELNAQNDWTKELRNQENGAYEIKEVLGGEHVHYQINENKPCANGYFEVCDEDVQVHVLNAIQTMGSIALEAVIKNENGDFITPDKQTAFYVDIKGANQKKTYVLNQQNQWRQTIEVDSGAYSIVQRGDDSFKEVYYLVDGTKECDVDLHIRTQKVEVSCVNVLPCAGGSLTIRKVIRDDTCDCFKRPDSTQEYEVEVAKEEYHQILTLSKDNQWKEQLEGLSPGVYRVCELHAQQAVSYIVNNEQECQEACVSIENNANTVTIINEQKCAKGSIEICKLLQDEEGCYRYPDKEAMYWIAIKSEEGCSRVLLNHANHFYASLRNLKDGWYEVCEESDRAVRYVVNNAAPADRAMVHVMGNANTVNVINPYQPKKGVLDIRKYIMSGDLLLRPDSGSYEILVKGAGEEKRFTLNQENQYHVVIENLNSGTYEVKELHGDSVSYIINATTHLDEAIVAIDGNTVKIQVVNHEGEHTGSLTLAKYIRAHQELQRPSKDASYVFHISRPGYNQLVTLDAANNWMTTLDHLENGTYVVAETTTTDRVSYIVNGGSECDYGIVTIQGNSNTIQIINTQRHEGGSIRFEKFMRRDHALIKPDRDVAITMHISKPGYQETFELNHQNNWTRTLEGLENGVYVIDEINAREDVTYVINGGSEVNRAIVTVRDNVNTVTIIDSPRKTTGSICIEKYMRNQDGELILPPDTFSVGVHVSKPGYHEAFTLNAANHFRITLQDLMDGVYVIDEADALGNVSYIVNGGSEVDYGVVRVFGNHNLVQMINTQSDTQGSLTITKVIRDAKGQLVLPKDHERFDVRITSNDFERRFVLAKDNHWQAHIEAMPNGQYTVQEQQVSGYQVSYIVDNKTEQASALFTMEGSAHTVKILNTRASALSTLEITKFIKQANGTLIRPADGDRFIVDVSNASYQQRLTLDNGNAFTYTLQDLQEGIYNVREEESEGFKVTYRVNGGTETDSASVTMTPGSRHVVEVINERIANQNTMEVFKYMLDAQGNYLPPQSTQVFRFTILSENIEDTYELNEANSWHQTLTQYPSGSYQIKEQGSPYRVQYLINSAELVDEARFEAKPQQTDIIGIINLLPKDGSGVLTLRKQMRQGNGELTDPNREDSFVVHVQGQNGFDDNVTLDASNQFTRSLQDLANDTYTIQEVNSPYAVSYIVDEGRESSTASIAIRDGASHTVTIINTRADLFYDIGSAKDDVTIVIQ